MQRTILGRLIKQEDHGMKITYFIVSPITIGIAIWMIMMGLNNWTPDHKTQMYMAIPMMIGAILSGAFAFLNTIYVEVKNE